MLFDFHSTYNDYSNVELLRIVLQAEKYRPEASLAAKEILASRVVTENDHKLAEAMLQSELEKRQLILNNQNALKDKLQDFFQPILRPGRVVAIEKWLGILILFLTVRYLWDLIHISIGFVKELQCQNCDIWFWLLTTLPGVLFFPVTIYLLLKRRKWGWILLFGNFLFMALSVIPDGVSFVYYARITGDYDFFFLFWRLFLHSGLAFFLWKEKVVQLFQVSAQTKRKTAIVTILGFLAVFGTLAIYLYWPS